MDVKTTLFKKILDGSFSLLTDEEIAKKLKLRGKAASAVGGYLRELVREGELYCDLAGRYGTAAQFGAVRGTISGNERGFGFFMPEDKESSDLFIPHRALRGAYNKDTVLAFRKGGRMGDEGEVLAVLERGYKEIVGTFRSERSGGMLHPDDRKFSDDIFIPSDRTKGASDGVKAVARILSFDGRSPKGEIVEILGESGEFFVEEAAIIRAHSLRETFPDEVLASAERQALRDPMEQAEGRLDLRDELIITVDGEDTRDIDDAISIRKENGKFYLGVHIADVTNYVTWHSPLDNEALSRGTSVYFPDRVIPMLPTALSNNICSLNEGVPRLTLSCLMTVDARGRVIERSVRPSVICSRHRMTYKAVTAIANGDESACAQYPDLIGFVHTAVELTGILKNAREAKGGVALDVKEAKILFEDGVISIPDYERTVSHEMIEQFMVLANESVAAIMTEAKMPFVYRIHERPDPEKARDFLTFLREAGVHAKFDPSRVSPADYRDLLHTLEGDPIYSLVNRVMLRSMMKAQYSPENVGHFGLASDCYCHFTSPIRRYPDLCIHRIIKESLTSPEKARTKYKKFVTEASAKSSAAEKNAAEAERDVDALYIVAYMQDKIGEEYDATVSGVTSFGVFAELANTVEGLIPLETLPDDSYEYVEERFLLRGTKNSFHLGEGFRVRVAGVDWGSRRVLFQFLGKQGEIL